MCAWCKMAISEKRYTAEVIDSAGNVYKFDSAACMVHYVREHNLRATAAAYFIADYESRAWLDARKASHVASDAIPSPMASGLASFGTPARAAEFAAARHGNVIAFEDLWTAVR